MTNPYDDKLDFDGKPINGEELIRNQRIQITQLLNRIAEYKVHTKIHRWLKLIGLICALAFLMGVVVRSLR